MPTYLITSTELDRTAEVEAPSPRKAKTTFLDYLERNGEIDRSQRHILRDTILSKKIEPGAVQSDINLNYSLASRGDPIQTFKQIQESVAPPTIQQPLVGTEEILKESVKKASELPSSLHKPTVHRPELYKRRAFTEFQRSRVPSSQVVKTYDTQREVPSIFSSPIAKVSRSKIPIVRVP